MASFKAGISTLSVAAVLPLVVGCGGDSAGPGPSPRESIRQQLRQVVSVDVENQPLAAALGRIGREYGVEIRLDEAAVKVQCGKIPKVSLRVRNIQLRSALHLLLHEPQLTYDLADGAIWVTTMVELARTGEVGRIHPVADLLGHDNQLDEANLAWLFDAMFPPPGSSPSNARGIVPRPGVLVVSRPPLVQDEIARVLREMRQLADPSTPPPPPHRTPAEAAVHRALDKPVSAFYFEKPLASWPSNTASTSCSIVLLWRMPSGSTPKTISSRWPSIRFACRSGRC